MPYVQDVVIGPKHRANALAARSFVQRRAIRSILALFLTLELLQNAAVNMNVNEKTRIRLGRIAYLIVLVYACLLMVDTSPVLRIIFLSPRGGDTLVQRPGKPCCLRRSVDANDAMNLDGFLGL